MVIFLNKRVKILIIFNFSGKLTANNNTNTGQGSGTFYQWWDNIMDELGQHQRNNKIIFKI